MSSTTTTSEYDVLENVTSRHIDVLDHGFVELVDVMPRKMLVGKTADSAIADAARVSYAAGTKTINDDKSLIRYLYRHKHTSPFEMVEFKFRMRLPIQVERQLIRHRTANVNEESGRYSISKDEMYVPTVYRQQSETNKQGGDEEFDADKNSTFRRCFENVEAFAYQQYESLLASNVSREMARGVLTQNQYTSIIWKMDARNLFHFLKLRLDKHAQLEIRQYAEAIYSFMKQVLPESCVAFETYDLKALTLSQLDQTALNLYVSNRQLSTTSPELKELIPNLRERNEFLQKMQSLFGDTQ